MKILYINKFFYRKGGAETVLFQEREGMLARGHAVMDFAMACGRNAPSAHAAHFVRERDFNARAPLGRTILHGLSFIHNPEAVRKLGALVDGERPDLAHMHNIYHQLTPSIIHALHARAIPTLLTLHDAKLACPSYTMLDRGRVCTACSGNRPWRMLTRACQRPGRRLLLLAEALFHAARGSYAKVDRFVSPSRFYADLIAPQVGPGKVTVLHNGVGPVPERPGAGPPAHYLYCGRLSSEKGVRTLCRAHALASPGLPLLVVGDGPLMADLRREFPSVRFAGHLDGEALDDAYRRAAFVVVPSRWYENCSMVVLEAFAHGKAVVGSAIGGIPEQVRHGECGLLVPAGDERALAGAIGALAADPARAEALGRGARDAARTRYALGAHLDALEALYHAMLAGQPAGRST